MTFDLPSLGWDADFRSTYAQCDRPDQRPARVARVDRGICSVLAADGLHRTSIGGGLLAAAARDPLRLPCAGDWVVMRTWPDERVTLEAVLPRRTAIVGSSAGSEALAQVLASNVDTVAVVAPMDPEPDLALVERLLGLAWESGAQPIVVLTKVDLAADPESIVEEIGEIAAGVEVHAVSAPTGRGTERLATFVTPGRTLGLLGASGAGKSTLVNALAGATIMGVQANRRADGRGRLTTTFRSLVPLPTGGCVLDTPGIRAAGLLDGLDGLDEIAHEMRRHDVRLAAQERLRWRRERAQVRRTARP